MSCITIRILPILDPISPPAAEDGLGEFIVELVEDDYNKTISLPISKSAFTTGKWTCHFEAEIDPPPSTDIVSRVVKAQGAHRNDPEFTEIGGVLYDWLLPPGPVRQRWETLISMPGPHSIMLEIGHPALARLPWEMAQGPAPHHIHIALVGGLHRKYPSAPKASPCSPWPFRILFVIGCSEAEETTLGIDQELQSIERAFVPFGRSIDLHCLRHPTEMELRTLVRTYHPHVLHFAGHGSLKVETGELGLHFDVGGGQSWTWAAKEIPTYLKGWGWTPAFVFLNACRSGLDHAASQSVQHAFLAAGTKVVLAMQADIRGDLAGPFAASVYTKCTEGSTIQEAVFEARLGLSPNGLSYIDWSLPVLMATDPDLKLFAWPSPPSDPAFIQCGEFEEAKVFANCREGRRLFTYWLQPPLVPQPPAASPNAAILSGQPRSGKSHLLKWCMESWTVLGARVRYIEISGRGAKTFLSILRQIRDGDSNGQYETLLLHSGLDPTAFRRFNWELENIINTGQPGEWNEGQHGPLRTIDSLRPLGDVGERRMEGRVCASFLDALRGAANAAPIVLVFDHFVGPAGERLIPPEEFVHLVQHLFSPIVLDPHSRIKLVFVVNQGQQTEFKLNALPADKVLRWNLPTDYTGAQLANLAVEMLGFQQEARIRSLAELLLNLPPGANPRIGLGRLKGVYTAIKDTALLETVERMR